MDNILVYILLIVLIVGALWLAIGYHNYKRMLEILDSYEKKEEEFIKKETLTKDMHLKAFLFNERMRLKDSYDSIHRLSETKKQMYDEQSFKKMVLKEYLKIGPIYNFWK